jgi:hypothetical protein
MPVPGVERAVPLVGVGAPTTTPLHADNSPVDNCPNHTPIYTEIDKRQLHDTHETGRVLINFAP